MKSVSEKGMSITNERFLSYGVPLINKKHCKMLEYYDESEEKSVNMMHTRSVNFRNNSLKHF